MRILRKTAQVFRFVAFYAASVLRANLRLSLMILHPRPPLRAGFRVLPLKTRTDAELFVYANLETMTPGTVVIGVSEDRKEIYVHEIFVGNGEAEQGLLLQEKVIEVMR